MDRQALRPPDDRLCPKCKGIGYLQAVREDDDATIFNDAKLPKLIDCPICRSNGQQEYLERMCGLSPEMRGWTFEGTKRTKANADALDYLAKLADKPVWTVALQGNNGVGKTRLLACLVNAGRAHGWTSMYTTMGALLDHLRSAYGAEQKGTLGFDAMWDRLTNCKILAIDECDRFNPTAWARERVFELVDERYRYGADRCTAFATNAPIDTLDDYLASRLRDKRGRAFHIAGGDWRQA